MEVNRFDFVVIGAGLAGLYSAIKASRFGKVAVLTKTTLTLSSSYWAQGGIAAAIGADDLTSLHFEDTLQAGRDLCNESAVEILVNDGKARVEEFISLGMPFDKENGKITLGLEGGHSRNRILHSAGDATGQELLKFVIQNVKKNNMITVFENHYAYRLIVQDEECYGVQAYDIENNEARIIYGFSTILASGGGAAAYSRSTNPHTSVGEGITLGFEAGAQLESMEFMQFHPTAFYSSGGDSFLISEAVRGEGAYLINNDGQRFLLAQNKTELSPRDVVAREIINEMNKSNSKNVYLDLRHLNHERMLHRFSNINSELLRHGVDFTKEPVSVAPAAHFMIGGIKTGLNGETNINRLYAVGETASTGVHGANRLASNSLLECLVFGKRAAEHAADFNKNNSVKAFPEEGVEFYINKKNENSFVEVKDMIANLLWSNAGIIRSGRELAGGLKTIDSICLEQNNDAEEYYEFRKRCLLSFARFIFEAAQIREESRGCHQRTDFKQEDDSFLNKIIIHKSSIQNNFNFNYGRLK